MAIDDTWKEMQNPQGNIINPVNGVYNCTVSWMQFRGFQSTLPPMTARIIHPLPANWVPGDPIPPDTPTSQQPIDDPTNNPVSNQPWHWTFIWNRLDPGPNQTIRVTESGGPPEEKNYPLNVSARYDSGGVRRTTPAAGTIVVRHWPSQPRIIQPGRGPALNVPIFSVLALSTPFTEIAKAKRFTRPMMLTATGVYGVLNALGKFQPNYRVPPLLPKTFPFPHLDQIWSFEFVFTRTVGDISGVSTHIMIYASSVETFQKGSVARIMRAKRCFKLK